MVKWEMSRTYGSAPPFNGSLHNQVQYFFLNTHLCRRLCFVTCGLRCGEASSFNGVIGACPYAVGSAKDPLRRAGPYNHYPVELEAQIRCRPVELEAHKDPLQTG